MRKLILSILLASVAATPALAGPDDRDAARQAAKAERQQQREERQQARDNSRPAKVEPSQPAHQNLTSQAQQQPPQQPQQQSFDRGQRIEQRQAGQQFQPDDRAARLQQRDSDRAARDAARDARRAQRDQAIDQRVQQGRTQIVDQPRHVRPAPVVSNTPRPGTQPPAPVTRRPSSAPNWSTNWRHNNRYDWQNHRRRHHSWFHLGFYYDPFGWGYSPYSIGWRMWPAYYGNRFWINDPWYYRLPYAPPGYQWVRYYNDAVLVDTWSGEVADVIYNFFW